MKWLKNEADAEEEKPIRLDQFVERIQKYKEPAELMFGESFFGRSTGHGSKRSADSIFGGGRVVYKMLVARMQIRFRFTSHCEILRL